MSEKHGWKNELKMSTINIRLRNTLPLLLTIILHATSIAQENAAEPQTDAMARQIRLWYNKGEMDSIYNRFSPNMQKAITNEALREAYNKQLKPFGEIVGFGFEDNNNGVSRYKLTTKSGTLLQMLLKVNDVQAIDAFAFQPYQHKPEKERTNIYTDNALQSHLDSFVNKEALNYLKLKFAPGMSIGILKGTNAYTYNYGESKPAEMLHPTAGTQYEIGSITKTMVAFVLADAFATGKLKYDETIFNYLPDSVKENKALEKITWVQLSNHTSGLPRLPGNLLKGSKNFNDSYAYYSKESLYEALSNIKLEHVPGTTYSYSNLAVGLLGTLLEEVYKETLDELLSRMIFKPNKMADTYVARLNKAPDTTMLATPHNAEGKRSTYWHFESLAGAGAVVSTTNDMLRYMLPLIMRPKTKGKTDPRMEFLDRISYEQSERVSLGWHFNEKDATDQTMEHSGGTAGFRTHLIFCPKRQVGVFVAINAAEDPGAVVVGNAIMKELLKQ